jgi:hypothetical protein
VSLPSDYSQSLSENNFDRLLAKYIQTCKDLAWVHANPNPYSIGIESLLRSKSCFLFYEMCEMIPAYIDHDIVMFSKPEVGVKEEILFNKTRTKLSNFIKRLTKWIHL